jgi:hypothetical protein
MTIRGIVWSLSARRVPSRAGEDPLLRSQDRYIYAVPSERMRFVRRLVCAGSRVEFQFAVGTGGVECAPVPTRAILFLVMRLESEYLPSFFLSLLFQANSETSGASLGSLALLNGTSRDFRFVNDMEFLTRADKPFLPLRRPLVPTPIPIPINLLFSKCVRQFRFKTQNHLPALLLIFIALIFTPD